MAQSLPPSPSSEPVQYDLSNCGNTMSSLIECVPNFSEGRDLARIQALVASMSDVPGASVLDCHSDPDHNRCVITLAGEPEAVAEAALRGVGKAAEVIDLTRHTGVHPRLGTTDVLPFVPLEGSTIEQCAALARRVGRQIWDRYRIPVYFYAAAATRAERVPLENIRRGQFEGLREAALLLPNRAPDIGGPQLHTTAGAVAVGARKFLIACNVNLQTSDLSVAKKIARTIRASNGGLPGVKAIGVPLVGDTDAGTVQNGLVQVSMNLTDFTQTPLPVLFDTVYREAQRHGCAVAGTEIVGLVPRKALVGASDQFMATISPQQILENRLASVFPQRISNEQPVEGILMKGAAH
jgi:glutamate formiminotransferase